MIAISENVPELEKLIPPGEDRAGQNTQLANCHGQMQNEAIRHSFEHPR
jgi:hypothetical protein